MGVGLFQFIIAHLSTDEIVDIPSLSPTLGKRLTGHVGAHGVHEQEVGGVSFWPTVWETRAAMGTADTPAEPMRGLTLPLVRMYIRSPKQHTASGGQQEGRQAQER